MIGDRFSAHVARSLGALAALGFLSCSGFMTSVGGGMTPELEQDGVSASAEILEVWDTGWTINDSPVIGMKVRVRPADRPDFEATIEKTTISRLAVPQFQPGNVIPVRFDPENPGVVAVDPEGGSRPEPSSSSGNPYRDRYERASIEGATFLPPSEAPQLYLGTADMATDMQTLFENDFALLGGSSVKNATNPQQALDQGREIGAALVVVYGHFVPPAGLALDVLPFARRAATGTSSADAGAMRLVSGSLGPEDQVATYWGKTRPPILGIVSRPLDAQEQARFHRQDGIVVETVLNGSPAAAAAIAAGDVIVSIEGRPLVDAHAVPEIISSLAGQRVRIDLLRDGSPMSVMAELNPIAP